MQKFIFQVAVAALALTSALAVLKPAVAADAPKTVVDIAVGSKDHTTLVAAVKAAGLVETLSGAGPFTVFAPTNAAFDKLPAGTVEALVKPEAKAKLTSILTYHVIAGKFAAADVVGKIDAMGGKFVAKTVNGAELTFTKDGGKVFVTDGNGGKAQVTTADIMSGNGVVHVIDTVLLPKG